jgi:pyridoxamine 5'-phosphate oxidase
VNKLMGHDFAQIEDPFALFADWLKQAEKREINDPNAMALATVDAQGLPDVRMVLLKSFDSAGFVFYSNADSAKGQELKANMKAAAVLHWKSLRRQIRFRGPVSEVSLEEADAYFTSRPLQSQIGAWASQQSRPLESRLALETAVAKFAAKFALKDIPRPPYWIGYRILPLQIEFWADRAFRLHDRLVFKRETTSHPWQKDQLYP